MTWVNGKDPLEDGWYAVMLSIDCKCGDYVSDFCRSESETVGYYTRFVDHGCWNIDCQESIFAYYGPLTIPDYSPYE